MNLKAKIIIVPLLALTFLASCNNKKQDPTVYYKLIFTCTNCRMLDEQGEGWAEKSFASGETAHLKLSADEDFKIPDTINVTLTGTGETYGGVYSYDSTTGNFSIKVVANVTIKATAVKQQVTYYNI